MLSAVISARHRYRALPLAEQPVHERSLRLGPLVLETTSLNTPTPTTDTDRTVSRRSEPSSCTTLTGEQPDPWDLLQPQDVISRHRGAKHADFRPSSRRRARSQAGFCLYTRRAITDRTEPTIARLRYSLGGDRPSQTTHQPRSSAGLPPE